MKTTIKLLGGLGNQMFQYALYLSMKHKGMDVCLDAKSFFEEDDRIHLAYHLDIFNAEFIPMEDHQYPQFILREKRYIHRVLRQLRISWPIYFEKGSTFDPNVFNVKKGTYIEGYWQSPKYFDDCLDVIKDAFQFKGKWSSSNLEYKQKIEECTNSVCVHIRRGDYLKFDKYLGICSENYYKKAIQYITENVKNPKFFVFSNDIEWSKKLFNDLDVCYITGNDGLDSYMDMILMTFCKHHIIANSTFSWWGAVLSRESEGITIAPEKWLNTSQTHDIWMDDWIKIGG